MTLLMVLLTVAVAVLGLLVAGLLRSHAVILRRLHELGAGIEDRRVPVTGAGETDAGPPTPSDAAHRRRARDLDGVTPSGDPVAVRVTGAAHDTLLVFLSSDCATCRRFWDALPVAQPSLPAGIRLVVVTKGPADESPSAIAELDPGVAPLVMSSEAWREHAVPGSPYVVLAGAASGRIRGEGTGADWDEVSRLLGNALGDAAPTHGRKARRDTAQERDVDRALLAAGIEPGDPSLYPSAPDEEPR